MVCCCVVVMVGDVMVWCVTCGVARVENYQCFDIDALHTILNEHSAHTHIITRTHTHTLSVSLSLTHTHTSFLAESTER